MEKKIYLAPAIEVLNARVEKGFAGSGDINIDSDLEHVHDNPNDYGHLFD